MIAKRDVVSGEELTFDYRCVGGRPISGQKFHCSCGAATCLDIIN